MPILATDISVGDHIQRQFLGLTINVDTVWATGVALLIVLALAWAVRRQATSGVPGRMQVAWEMGVETVTEQIRGSIGERGLSIVPLAMSLFVFILICNTFEVFGLGGEVRPPRRAHRRHQPPPGPVTLRDRAGAHRLGPGPGVLGLHPRTTWCTRSRCT